MRAPPSVPDFPPRGRDAPGAWEEPDYRTLVVHSPHLVARFDADQRLVYLNPAADAVLNARPDWAGRTSAELADAHPAFHQWADPVRRAVDAGEASNTEAEVVTENAARVLRSRIVPEPAGDGGPGGALVYAEDITEQRRREVRLSRRADIDALSGVYNRAGFLRLLEQACEAGAVGTAFAVLFVDLDQFKSVNDRHGHATGDAVLRVVAERLLASVRPSDVVGRLGGDEFAVLLRGVAREPDAIGAVQRIQRSLAQPVSVGNLHLRVTASVGLALGSEIEDPRALLAGADRAMYHAKSLGAGHYQVMDDAAEAVESAVESVENALRQGIEQGELTVRYQPIVALADGAITGVEALVRWKHPERGLIGPQAFLPVAEQSGLVVELDRWVARAVAGDLRGWGERLGPAALVPVSVNLSASHVVLPGVPDFFRELLDEFGVSPRHLQVEITETALLDITASIASTLARLHDLGILICLDDFGTGYSSLTHLRQFSFDVLKIDRSFVARMLKGRTDLAIVGSVVGLARTLGLCAVAEGVESAAQRDVLQGVGCERGQGYYFGRPAPAAAVEAMLEARAGVSR